MNKTLRFTHINHKKAEGFVLDFVNVILSTVFSIIVLFIITRIIGKRQVAQLSLFDYVNGITIGSIAAEMATAIEHDMLKPLISMIIYAFFAVLISICTNKSQKFRTFLSGRSIVLFRENKFFYDNFKKARMDLNEFLIQMRNSGYFSLEDVYCAILEPNGKISVLERSGAKNITAKDMNIRNPQQKLQTNLVCDGKIMYENLKLCQKNEKWLLAKLKENNVSDIKNVFLASADNSGNLFVYTTHKK